MNLLEGKEIVKDFRLKREGIWGKRRIFRAVDHVNIALGEQMTIGIVGESGSGKSTLGEILGNLQKQTEGIVLYKGKDISKMNDKEYRDYRRNVQFIFQNPTESMNPYYTIEKVLKEPMQLLLDDYNEEKASEQIEIMLEKVGLASGYLRRYPSELSGGQCQRVAIARALLLNPEVIVCDECVSALDVSVQAQILNLLKSLQKEFKTSYLFISHDIGVINYISDYVIVMVKGQLIEEGNTENILNHPVKGYTRQLITSSLFTEEAVCV